MHLKIGANVYIVELETGPKSIGQRRTKSDLKTIVKTFAKALAPGRDHATYVRAKARYDREKENFRATLHGLLDQFLRGELSQGQFSYRIKREFKAMHELAFRLGTDAGGLGYMALPKEDLRWVEKFRRAEYTYLNKFIDDIVNGRGTMKYHDRLDMYVDTVDSLFHAGRVDTFPEEGTKIYWMTGASAQVCPDCDLLAAESPYTPGSLPTTPRAGDTSCLSKCNCTLRIRYEPPQTVNLRFERADLSLIGKETIIDWNAVDDIMTNLLELQVMDRFIKDRKVLAERRLSILDEMEAKTKRLPKDLIPLTEEFEAVHRIGAWVLREVASG